MEIAKTVIKIQNPNIYLFNLVSSCLLKDFRFYDTTEERRGLIISALNTVSNEDPEFVLQLAYYLRNQLYIRTTTNFILAFAALNQKTAPFLAKYFNKSVLLPSDFLEVCQWSQILYYLKKNNYDFEMLSNFQKHDFRRKLYFGSVLKDALKEKFKSFSNFQLGKYCSEARRKKILRDYQEVLHPERLAKRKEKLKKKLEKNQVSHEQNEKNPEKMEEEKSNEELTRRGKDSVRSTGRGGRVGKMLAKKRKFMQKHTAKPVKPKNMFEIPFITMKDVIKTTHMKSPQFVIRSILGKRYPENELSFQEAFTGEEIKFDPTLAKKRMKIETPKTWETELSSKGNKPEVWSQLISSNQLPYMAMVRNLRNLLKIGLEDHLHAKVIQRICNEKAVKNAKMFPFQYFSALSEIDSLKKKEMIKTANKFIEVDKIIKEDEEMKEEPKPIKSEINYSIDTLVDDYKDSITKAIQIAVDKNLEPIIGHTLIFCDVSGSMRCKISGGKCYGSVRNCKEVALLLGLMIKSKCETSSFYIFSSPGYEHKECYLEVKLESKDILKDMQHLDLESEKLGGGTDFPFACIRKHIDQKIKVDNIIILSDMMISEGYEEIDTGVKSTSEILNEYRNKVNNALKIFSIDLRGYAKVLNLSDEFNEENYIRIFGMSDGVLKFISVKEKGSQVDEIKKFAADIDKIPVQGN